MKLSSTQIAQRKDSLGLAFLGHRLSRAQVQDLLSQVELPQNEWDDTYQQATTGTLKVGEEQGPAEVLDELGLSQRFQALTDDEVWSPRDRAIYRQVSKLDAQRRPEPAPQMGEGNPLFFRLLEENFENWDRDNNTRLELSELDFLMSGGFYGTAREVADRPETATALAVLRRHLEYVQSADPYDGAGVSRRDLYLIEAASTEPLAQMKSMVSEDFQEYLEFSQAMVQRKLLSDEDIRPEAIQQGVAGSCVFLSTMVGLSAEELRAMVRPDPGGESSFTVSFPDGSEQTVSEPTVAERLYHARGNDQERWPAIFELAMAQKLYREVETHDSALRSAIDGIEPERAIETLTGRQADRRNLDEISVAQTREALLALTSRQGPVICGSRPAALTDFISEEELQNGIQNSHCYAILNFDAEGDSVTLRNPWGRREWHYQDSPEDGVFEMPLRDFYSSFRWVAGVADDQ